MNGMFSAWRTFILPRAVKVTVTDDTLSVDLEDGRTISVPIGWYPRLLHGTTDERNKWRLLGEGIHWPDLHEDIGVEGLLLGKQTTESQKSLDRWLQKRK